MVKLWISVLVSTEIRKSRFIFFFTGHKEKSFWLPLRERKEFGLFSLFIKLRFVLFIHVWCLLEPQGPGVMG